MIRVPIFCVLMLFSNPVLGEFKPLTRDEPIVRMVLQEANNEPFAGMVAVAGVAFDRKRDRRWPPTMGAVIYQRAQFSGMAITLRKYSQAQVELAREAVEQAAVGTRPCGTVLYYHNTSIVPDWDYTKIDIVCWIGDHLFYEDEE